MRSSFREFMYPVLHKLGVLVVLIAAVFLYKLSKVSDYPVHYHANFAIFINENQLDLSKPDNMHLKPCTQEYIESDTKSDNIHLHDMVGNVIHIHQEGVTWGDVLTALHIEKEIDFTVKDFNYFENGMKADTDILDKVVKNDVRLLITTSDGNSITENEALKKQYESTGSDAHEYDEGKKGLEGCSGNTKRTLLHKAQIAINEMLQLKI